MAEATYETVTREGCGLLPAAEDGKLLLTGSEAAGLLDGQLSNDVAGLAVGSGCEAVLLTPKGRMLAPVRVLHRADGLLLLTERATLQSLWDRLRSGGLFQVRHRGLVDEPFNRLLEGGALAGGVALRREGVERGGRRKLALQFKCVVHDGSRTSLQPPAWAPFMVKKHQPSNGTPCRRAPAAAIGLLVPAVKPGTRGILIRRIQV